MGVFVFKNKFGRFIKKHYLCQQVYKMKIVILRGLPGCGKSTFAEYIKELSKGATLIATADDYFMKTGEYVFDKSKLHFAHQECRDKVTNSIDSYDTIIVANTNTTTKEVMEYIKIANSKKVEYFVLTVENWHNGIDVHNVPQEHIEVMKKRLSNSIQLDKSTTFNTTPIKEDSRIIQNAFITPDGTILKSTHRHDFNQHQDTVNDRVYIIDGGIDYIRSNMDDSCINLTISSTENLLNVRDKLVIDSKFLNTISNEHITDVINKNDLDTCIVNHLKNELIYRRFYGENILEIID